jgi:hypothetical protein
MMSQIVTYGSKPPERVFFLWVLFIFFLEKKKSNKRYRAYTQEKMDILELTKF